MKPARHAMNPPSGQFIQHDGGARINTLASAANDAIQPITPPEHGARWIWWLWAAGIAAGVVGSMWSPWGWAL